MFISNLEKIIAIKFVHRRRDFVDDQIDKLAPPIFIIIFARAIDWFARRHRVPRASKCAIEFRALPFQSEFAGNERVMIANATRQKKECAGGVEKDRFYRSLD